VFFGFFCFFLISLIFNYLKDFPKFFWITALVRSIATQVSMIKVKVTVTKNRNSIDTKSGACNQCNQSNGIIFSTLPSFISYSCHINTWLNRCLYTLLLVCFGKLCYKNLILMNKYWHIIKSNCLRANNKQRNNPIKKVYLLSIISK